MAEPLDNRIYQPELFDPSTSKPPKSNIGNTVEGIALDIRERATGDLDPTKFAQGYIAKQQASQSFLGGNNKVSTYNYETDLGSAYTQLNNGTYISRFKNFLPGTDNEQRLASQQSTGDKWGNGLIKFLGKTGTAVLGGTIGIVDGAIQGISEGSLSAAYDSDFNNWLDDLNTKMDYRLPNYYTKQEKEQGFFNSMGTANFWANDVLGALSFTTGAIVSEGLWAAATGGTSLLGKGILSAAGRAVTNRVALNTVKGEVKTALNQAAKKGLKDYAKTVTNTGRVIEGLNTTRFLVTSAGYEAGVEARHYIKDTREQWLQNFEQTMGRTPTAQERAEFNDRLTDTANGVFGVNMGLVGASNFATIGRLALGRPVRSTIENNSLKRFFFGVGYEKAADGTYKTLKATRLQKTFGRIYTAGKMGFVEGVFEEGGQGVVSSTAEEFMLNGYDEQGARTSLDISSALIDGIKNTYGTKEGFKEVGIGIIVGLLGGGVNQATTGQGLFGEVESERQNMETYVKIRNQFTNDLTVNQLVERLKTNSKIQKAVEKREQAELTGDATAITMSDQELMVATIQRDYAFQGIDQGIDDFTSAMATIPNEELATELGIALEDVDSWKQQKISEYTNMASEYSSNIEFAKALVGNLPIMEANDPKIRTEIERAIAFNLSMGAQANELAKTYVEEIKVNIGAEVLGNDITRAMDVQEQLRRVEPKKRSKLGELSSKKKKLEEQRDRISRELVGTQYETTSPNEDATARTNRQKELQDKLIEVEGQIEQTRQEQQLLLDAINISNVTDENITVEELDNQEQAVKKLQQTVETIKESNPQRYDLLANLFKEYEKAINYARSYDSTTKKITDPNTAVTEISGWVSKLTSKLRKVDNDDVKFFADLVTQYQTNQERIKIEANNIQQAQLGGIEKEEWNNFLNNGEVSPERLESIATKIANNQQLAPKEEDIRKAKSAEVEKLLKEKRKGVETPPATDTTTPPPKNSIESIERQVNEIINGRYSAIYNGEDAIELAKKEPSKKDLKRYNDLLAKINPSLLQGITFRTYDPNSGLTQEEFNEFIELNQKLNDWKTVQGTMVGESDSLAGLLQLLRKKQQQFEKQSTNTDISEKNFAEIRTAPENRPEKEASESVSTIQSPNQVLVAHEKGTRKYRISHMNISSLTALIPEAALYKVDKNGNEKLDDGNNWKQEGNVYVIKSGEEKLRVEIGPRARLLIDIESFDSFPKNLKLLTFRNGKATYYSAYTKKGEQWVPVEGDFGYASTLENEDIDYVPERTYDLEDGQILRTEVNKNDVYNAQLLEEYEKAKKSNDKVKIKQAKEALIQGINIYVMPQGSTKEVVGSLRAVRNTKQSMSNSVSNLYNLRKKAVEKVLRSKSDKVDLGRTIQVRFTLVGNPNIQVQEDSQGNLVPANVEFTNEMLSQVEDIGYIENGKIKTQKGLQLEDRNTIFARAIQGKGKTPIIVFTYRGLRQAFPIALKRSTVDKSGRAKDILRQSIPASQKIIQLEDELIDNNLDPNEYDIDPNYEAEVNGQLVGWENSPAVQKALEDLSAVEEFEDVERFLDPSYDKANLKNVALTPLDISDRPFTAGKTIINLDNIGYIGQEEELREERSMTEGEMQEMESTLSGYAIQLYKDLLNPENAELYGDIENQYTDVFAENDVYRNPESWTERMHNVNILREALQYINKSRTIKNNVGTEVIEQMKRDLKNFDRTNKERAKITGAIRTQVNTAKECL